MSRIITKRELVRWRENVKDKRIVLVGGCFDILHPGHIIFLEKAKKAGDVLMVLLESDEKVKKLKGEGRPVHNQLERAQVLSALASVDYIIMLPYLETAASYDEITLKVKPAIIAATSGDKNSYLPRSAKIVGAKLKYVTKFIGNHSSSRILGGRQRK